MSTSSTSVVLASLVGNEPTHLSALQLVLVQHLPELKLFWATVFLCTLCTAIVVGYAKGISQE